MTQFTDPAIRRVLIRHITSFASPPRALMEEVRVHNGNAIADVVAIHRTAHCYEIKGATDSLARLTRQASYYDRAFNRVTLVTTENHLRNALALAPAHWGLLVVHKSDHDARLSYCRAASNSPSFDKTTALLTLWKSELLSLCPPAHARLQKLSRLDLSEWISAQETRVTVSEKVATLLVDRQANNGWPTI